MPLVKCKAIRVFTEFVSNFGMVHGNPEGSDEKARFPMVPEEAVAKLAAEGKVEPVDPDSLPQLDHDGDGHPGGSISATGDDIATLRKLYKDTIGKAPFNGWSAEELRKRIADAAPADEDAPI
ncbi:hypothetical protein OOT33_13645 [Sphingobium sp. DEHP117]|uniref:hypothetical protein n=1 Tax=Sphingobium sp. DEHP117 TaxID=2993436 RepID=UPI0027D602D2|nr:hypothetical protein [Sphingobium sp. DEHP117]MDQ4421466.1 hypothetical protein [Sphingobium sp. DEHP117]